MADLTFAVLTASGIAHAAVGFYLVTRRRMRFFGVVSALIGLAVLSLSITLRSQGPSEVSSAPASLYTDLADRAKALTKANNDLQQLQQELLSTQRAADEARQAEVKTRAEADARSAAVADRSKALAKTTSDLQQAQKELAAAQHAADEARQAEVKTRVESETQLAAAELRTKEAEAIVIAAKKAQAEALDRADAARKRSALYQRKYHQLRQARRNVPEPQKPQSYSLFQLLFGSPTPQ